MGDEKDNSDMETESEMIGIVGFGNIGMNILQTFAQAGKNVLGIERDQANVDRYLKRSEENLSGLVAKGKISPDEKKGVLKSMRITRHLEDLSPSTTVIESIDEAIEPKKQLFRQIDAVVDQRCLLLSNTSSLSVTEMAACVSAPERFAGMHFFNPVPVMKLVEIVRGLQTSESTIKKVETLAADLGKESIISADKPAFVVNRMLNALAREAVLMLEEGIATAADIDKGARLGLGHPMGPLELFDYLGCIHLLERVLDHMAEELDPKFRPPVLLKNMVRAGWWGTSSGRGFYGRGPVSRETGKEPGP